MAILVGVHLSSMVWSLNYLRIKERGRACHESFSVMTQRLGLWEASRSSHPTKAWVGDALVLTKPCHDDLPG